MRLFSKEKCLWGIFLIFFSVALVKFHCIGYETNDDLFLSLIPSGFLGIHSPYTIHNNIVIGGLLVFLNYMISAFNVTTVFYFVCIMISYFWCGVYLIERKGKVIGSILSYLLFFISYEMLLERMNYSKSAVIIIVAGMLWFQDSLKEKSSSKRKVRMILSGIWFVLGCLIRYKTTLAVLPFVFLFIFYTMEKENRKSIFHGVLPWGCLVLIVLLLWGTDYVVYHANEDWSSFKAFNDARERLIDYELPGFSENEAKYQEIGFSETDVELLRNWVFADSTKYNTESFEKILAFREENGLSPHRIKDLYHDLFKLMKTYSIIMVAMLFMILDILVVPKKKLWYVVATFGVMTMEIAYLIYVDRTPERAVFITAFSAFILFIYFLDASCMERNRVRLIFALCMILGCTMLDSRFCRNYAVLDEGQKEATREFLQTISNDSDGLYVWDIKASSESLLDSYNVFDQLEYGLYSNSVFAGGWLAQTPDMVEHIKGYGEAYNVLKLLATNSNVYLVDYQNTSSVGLISEYLKEHYNSELQCELVEERNGYAIYHFE